MPSDDKNNLTQFIAVFINELVRSGVRHAVVSPGSRSTPLAILLRNHPNIKVWMNLDERSAGFFAMGIAKSTGHPAVLLCSSGTAAANYYPAIIEARYARVPLIALTADRPHDLREVGAPQAIDQVKLYGDHVKWHVDMPLPSAEPRFIANSEAVGRRSVQTAVSAPMGPVHINFPFQEPLMPHEDGGETVFKNTDKPLNFGSSYAEPMPAEQDIQSLHHLLQKAERPLFIAGPGCDERLSPVILNFAENHGIPVVADPLSHLRRHASPVLMTAYDAFLRDPRTVENLEADLVIRFGAMPVSKSLLKYLEASEPNDYVVIDGGRGWLEPTHLATQMIYAEGQTLLQAVAEKSGPSRSRDAWLERWEIADQISVELLEQTVKEKSWFEGVVAYELINHLPEDGVLFAGNSMPIRDIDTFLTRAKNIEVVANRGTNGIDGVVSSALGYAATRQEVFLTIGDLSFFHDMNGLMAAKQHGLQATIVVINNNGGGIFSFLPQAGEAEHFEELFGTPTDLNVEAVAGLYGGDYFKAESRADLLNALETARDIKGLKIIEAVTDRKSNTDIHREMWRRVSQQLAQK